MISKYCQTGKSYNDKIERPWAKAHHWGFPNWVVTAASAGTLLLLLRPCYGGQCKGVIAKLAPTGVALVLAGHTTTIAATGQGLS
ncbi:hypothetical protein TREES_T100019243 [Tupaia chinensis]|uniref:Uncharacterized protein n=1 Tax=Tupaia chinensis TaxID=246437 RepID=L9L9R4_TUPCH|nr:hypothetical protein TREES_T100019243 [Tupaia chinensis]